MNFFKNINEGLKKGIQKAKDDVEGVTSSEKFGFAEMKNQILDKNIDDATVLLNMKKFLTTSVSSIENDEIAGLFVTHRPEAREKLIGE